MKEHRVKQAATGEGGSFVVSEITLALCIFFLQIRQLLDSLCVLKMHLVRVTEVLPTAQCDLKVRLTVCFLTLFV